MYFNYIWWSCPHANALQWTAHHILRRGRWIPFKFLLESNIAQNPFFYSTLILAPSVANYDKIGKNPLNGINFSIDNLIRSKYSLTPLCVSSSKPINSNSEFLFYVTILTIIWMLSICVLSKEQSTLSDIAKAVFNLFIKFGLSVSTIEFNKSLYVVGLKYCKSPSLISSFLNCSSKFN